MTNGIDLTTINRVDYLFVAQGRHTNAVGPSANLAYSNKYAFSGAVLFINLTMLEAIPIMDDYGKKFIYNLCTLNDLMLLNKNGITDLDLSGPGIPY